MLSKVRLLIELAILLIVIILAVFFAMSNESRVTVDYFVDVIELPLGLALIFMFVLGGALGYVVRLPSTWALRGKLAHARKKLAQYQSQDVGIDT